MTGATMKPTLNAFAYCLARELGIAPELLFSERRTLPVARCRCLVMAVALDDFGYGPNRAGAVLNRKHSTVIHGAAIGRRLRRQPKFARAVAAALASATAEREDTARAVQAYLRNIQPTNHRNAA